MPYRNPTPSIDFGEQIEQFEIEKKDYKRNESVYFAFLDVLGFKQAFNENDDNCAERYKDVFIYFFDLMNSANFMHSTGGLSYAGQTSDSLYFYTDREDYLVEFLKIYSHLSVYAMTQDVFFRGGVAKGNLFLMEEGYRYFGNSVIFAYLLESEISRNPVVAIDEETNNALSIYPEYKYLIMPEKNRYILNPFAFIANNFNLSINANIVEVRPIDINKVYDKISMNKKKFEYDVKNYEKYYFLNELFKPFLTHF